MTPPSEQSAEAFKALSESQYQKGELVTDLSCREIFHEGYLAALSAAPAPEPEKKFHTGAQVLKHYDADKNPLRDAALERAREGVAKALTPAPEPEKKLPDWKDLRGILKEEEPPADDAETLDALLRAELGAGFSWSDTKNYEMAFEWARRSYALGRADERRKCAEACRKMHDEWKLPNDAPGLRDYIRTIEQQGGASDE